MFWLYILQWPRRTFYAGHTEDLDERMRQHECGVANSYTATRKPLRLIFVQEFERRYEALSMERKLKGWSREKKLAHMASAWNRVSELAKGRHRHERF